MYERNFQLFSVYMNIANTFATGGIFVVLKLLSICQLPEIVQLKEDVLFYKMYFVSLTVFHVWKIIY